MAVTATPYSSVLSALVDGTIDYLNDDIVTLITTFSYVPAPGVDAFLSDVTNELSGGGYARQLLTGKSKTFVAPTLYLIADDPIFPSLTATGMRYLVWAKDTGTASTSPLIGYWDLGANYNATANDFNVLFDDNDGFMTLTLV